MKIKDKAFIREIISSGFKQISNPDFNRNTIDKIKESEVKKITHSTSGDITFLIPVLLYVSLFILFSFIDAIFSLPYLGQVNNIMNSIEMISGILLHPVTISILFAFSLLYLFDLFLKKIRT